MYSGDSGRELRTRQATQLADIDRLVGPSAPCGSSIVVITATETAYPTAGGVYYAVKQVDLGGLEVEGGAGTFATVDGIFYALALTGSAVPAVGSKLICDSISGRWCFRA